MNKLFLACWVVAWVAVVAGCTGPYGGGWEDATALHKTAWIGDVHAVRRELAKGADPYANARLGPRVFCAPTGAKLHTPMSLAIERQHAAVLHALMSEGVHPTERDLGYAAVSGYEMIRLLLDAGLDPNSPIWTEQGPDRGTGFGPQPSILSVCEARGDRRSIDLLRSRGARESPQPPWQPLFTTPPP